MSSNLIFEIGTEEIPARFVPLALKQFKENAKRIFDREALAYQKLQTLGTPRRLVLNINELAESQNTRIRSVQGPAKRIAYTENGEITKAGESFARSQGVDISQLQIKNTERGEYVFAIKEEQGEKTLVILKKILPEIISSISFPRTMRWDGDIRFARPIRWCLALHGNEVVEFNLNNLTSGNKTFGHRLIKNESIEIINAEDYFLRIKKAHIVIDPERRKKIILNKIKKAANELQGIPIIPDDLLDEVVNLVEYPEIIVGSFNDEFLEIPKEVLIETMTLNQKYFPVEKKDASLLNKFIFVANNKKDISIIREGNEKVLSARLADAKFFYYEDVKTTLIQKTEKLKKVLFQEALGTLFEKSKRIESLALWIADKLNLHDLKDQIIRCSILCKADLVTEMVKEFPKLQGVMGSIYAQKSAESKEVADGIFEHYLPRYTGDKLPETKIGSLISIADKLNTISGCFIAGLIPSGSEDPYALRRQAMGIIEIMLHNSMEISLDEIVAESIKPFSSADSSKTLIITDFLIQRLNYILQEKKLNYDSLEAVFVSPVKIPVEIQKKTKIIDEMRLHPDMIPLVLSFKRITNITKDYKQTQDLDETLFKEEAEKKLYDLYKNIKEKIEQNLKTRDYLKITQNLLQFAFPLENFFIKVLVMDAEPYRNNRIVLLKKIRELFLEFADFSKLVYSSKS